MKLEKIKTKTTAELVAFYNAHSGRPVIKKFADRTTAEKRVGDLVKARSMHAKPEPVAKKNGAAKPAQTKPERGLVHSNSKRALVLSELERTNGTTAATSLMKVVYGSTSKDYRGPLMMVIKGLTQVLAKNGQTLKRERVDGETYFSIS
jgi:hypothetical protein